jgi:hypothetical protein
MADPKGSKAATIADVASVQAKNTIDVMMEDLTEEDQKEAKQLLEEEMVELRRKKLTCFRKMCNGVVKKADTVTATSAKLSMHLSPKDTVHMVDVTFHP